MRFWLAFFFIILSFSVPARAWLSVDATGYPGEYLLSYSGSGRGIALGFAQVALSGQTGLLYSNPASLSGLWSQEASFSITPLFEQSQFISAGYGYPFNDKYTAGVQLLRLTSGDAEKTNALGETIGSFSDQETAILICCASKLTPELRWGVTAKVVSQEIDTFSGKGIGLDGGVIYRLSPEQVWALSLMNLVPARIGEDSFPFAPRLGFWHGMFRNKLGWTADFLLMNLGGPGNQPGRWYTGLEYRQPEWLFWRIGVNQKQVAAGFGISTRQIDFDYAIAYHPLGLLHTITLNIRYGMLPSEAEEKVKNEWDMLKAEKEEYAEQRKKDLDRIRFENEKLNLTRKLTLQFMEARRLYDDKEYSGSRKLLEAILARDPGMEEARLLLGEIKARFDTETAVNRLKDGHDFYARGNYSEALRLANYVLDIQPQNTQARVLAYLAQAQIFASDKKFMDAKGELIEILKLDPANPEASQLLKRIQTVIDISGEQ